MRKVLFLLTAANFALLVMLVAQFRPVSAQTAPSVLRATALEIVDSQGKIRANLKATEDGVILQMADSRGLIRVKLGAGQDGSGLMLANDSQQPGALIQAKATGTILRLTDKDGQRTIEP